MIDKKEEISWLFNYVFFYKGLMLFTLMWLIWIGYDYTVLIKRPSSLYSPILNFQKLLTPELISPLFFYGVIVFSVILSLMNFLSKNIFRSLLLMFLVMWLNAIRWCYGFASHVDHTFLLSHLFFVFTPNYNSWLLRNVRIEIRTVKVAVIGVLITYSMAGFWKCISLVSLIYKDNWSQVSWLHKDAVELNAIVNRRSIDNQVSDFMLELYQIPYVWEMATIFVFIIQFTAVLSVVSRKYSYLVLVVLVSFHIYNTLFIDIVFYVAPIVLTILLFPYHLVLKEKYKAFQIKNSQN